jgi:beta-glucosidase
VWEFEWQLCAIFFCVREYRYNLMRFTGCQSSSLFVKNLQQSISINVHIFIEHNKSFNRAVCINKASDHAESLLKHFKTMLRTASSDEMIQQRLNSMTMEEKIGQMSQIDIKMLVTTTTTTASTTATLQLNASLVDYWIGQRGIGSVLNTVSVPWTARDLRRAAVLIRNVSDAYHRPPVIWGLDSVHGANFVHGATLTPQPLNIAATFNTTCAEQAGILASRDTRAAGISWLFSPILGLALEPRWSRNYETFGEDPHVVSQMARAMTDGIQRPQSGTSVPSKAAACAKHFVGYSAPKDGHDRSPAWIPTRQLYQYFVLPWKNLAALTVMESYSETDGVPNVANPNTLNYLLRERLEFDGVLVTDYEEMRNYYNWHHGAASDADAIVQSLQHGSVDMSMIPWDANEFVSSIVKGLDEHQLIADRINTSAERVLRLKQELFMFDEVFLEDDPNLELVGTDEASVMHMVHQSMILTKNYNATLPLLANRPKILVTGPTASSRIYQSGGWTCQWQGAPIEQDWFSYGSTLLGAFMQESTWDVSYSCGTDILGGECDDALGKEGIVDQVKEWAGLGPHSSIDRAVEAALSAEYVVICVGEEAYAEKPGDIRSLRLPEGQYALVRAIKKNTSAKIILVYFGGRTRLLEDMVDAADSIVIALLPGPSAGQALTDIISGRINPSGKLPITYPKFDDGGGSPYFHSISDRCTSGDGTLPHFDYVPCEIQWPFGYGLSYTEYKYSNLMASGGIDEDLQVSVSVKNVGSIAGEDAVLFFTFDDFRSTTPEYKRLRTFYKVHLEPGEEITIERSVPLDELMFIGPEDSRHYIMDPHMKSWVGVGADVDCRVEPESTDLCVRLKATHPETLYVGACESACNVWMESGCASEYNLSRKSCLDKCTSIGAYRTGSIQVSISGWGWDYVNCLESVVWGFKRKDSGGDCWMMTSFCRNIFATEELDYFGVGSTLSLRSTGSGYSPYTNYVSLIPGFIASLMILYFIKGGSLLRRKRSSVTTSSLGQDDAIEMTRNKGGLVV